MKKSFLLVALLMSSSSFAKIDRTQFPSNLKCRITQTNGKKFVKDTEVSTVDKPVHVINEEIGSGHVLSILLSGDDYPQQALVRLLDVSKGVEEIYATSHETMDMCNSVEISGRMSVEGMKVNYSCKAICSDR